jgi:hypothetical protein
MSYTGSPAQGQQAPLVTKNQFFTYIEGSRSSDQIWNVGEVTICVQGTLKEFGAYQTYFAKKHLLTFSGGKTHTASPNITYEAGLWYKVDHIFNKRLPGRPGVKTGSTAKYGRTRLSKETAICTFIVCDYFSDPNALRGIIAGQLRIFGGDRSDNTLPISFQKKCVCNVTVGNWDWSDNCNVTYKMAKDKKAFMLTHLERGE